MNVARAFLAGVIGGIVMSIGLAIGREIGIPADLEHTLGTLLLPPGQSAFVVGYTIHLMISGLIGIVYAWGFELVACRSGPAIGAAFGFAHAIVAGIGMTVLPLVHPLIPETVQPYGPFMSTFGTVGVVATFVVYAAYGATVGLVYAERFASPHVRG